MFSIAFPNRGPAGSKPLFIRGTDLKKVVFDGPKNDIAYILFDPRAAEGMSFGILPVNRALLDLNPSTLAMTALSTNQPATDGTECLIGHEYGHYVYDFYLTKSKGMDPYAPKPLDFVQYHLTVDAIGIRLAGSSTTEHAKGFKNTLIRDIFGEKRLVNDAEGRVKCLFEL